ncbi:hypothetical protein DL95DRAFT_506725 [Leptodontidium sp. 2 PMI_412]|nr:hypothetical protein DL95DRAFT_506725 [Leptodontidium sp. 2 PMI_412]
MRAAVFAIGLMVMVLSGHTAGQDLDPSTCLAPIEYESCSKSAQDELGKCQDLMPENIRHCVCNAQAAVINCVGSYCWKNVYGCEYQELAEEMQTHCIPASLENQSPFWPAPLNVPGACSCDTSIALMEITASSDRNSDCSGEVTWNCYLQERTSANSGNEVSESFGTAWRQHHTTKPRCSSFPRDAFVGVSIFSSIAMWCILITIGLAWLRLAVAWDMPRGQKDPSTCVAPAEYETCNRDALATLDNCMSGKKREVDAYRECLCLADAFLLNCEGQFCWNKVYGCEYNDLVGLLLDACTPDLVNTDEIPFWPAPANAPGACSCDNSATDLANSILWTTTHEACSNGEVEDTNDKNSTWNCNCCYWSLSSQATMESCPKYDFPYLRYDDARRQNLSGFDETWFSCQDTLPTADCKALGYSYTGEVYLPSNLPLPGTETMSNLAGQVTAPVSGWTYTWSAASYGWVVTAFSPTGTIIGIPTSTDAVSSSRTGLGGTASAGSITTAPTGLASAPTSSPTTTTSTSWGQTARDGRLIVKGGIACVMLHLSLQFWL